MCCGTIEGMSSQKNKKGWHFSFSFKRLFLGIVVLGIACTFIVSGIFLLWASTLTMPTIDIIEKQRENMSTKIYDRTGEVLLYDMHQDVRRTVIPLEDVSDYVKHATIAIEDANFYNHFGVEPFAIFRAIVRNLQDGDLLGGQGGSTITQQVVKNTLLVSEKKVSRKLKEWVLAVKLEKDLSKDKILEIYLNEIPYGGTKYGIEAASQGFFGKSAKDLTLAESAYLAALPQAPSYYSPYGKNRQDLDKRKNKVLQKMLEFGHVSEDEYKNAIDEVVEFRPFTSGEIKAPHFVFYVIDQLSKMYGEENLAQSNLKVITTLDWDLEKEAERIVYERAHENTKTYNASNASLMAIDPKTGGILVMVGSRDYFDEEVDGNYNIGLAERQPGSSFKPFAYAAAIQKGYTTETVVYDVKTQFSTACEKSDFSTNENCYSPGNYDNVFRGPMTFREALAQSVNIPAIKVLYLAGMKNTIELARSMGISTLEEWQRYGLTLVLGGGEVSLLEMTSAYGVFANEGYRYPYTSIKEIYKGDQKEMYNIGQKSSQIIEPEVARAISDMLADNEARTPAFGLNSYLHFPDREVAVKTGTTNDYRDTWIIGYTPEIAVGAWAGNNNNTPMEKKVAGFIIAPMWNEFMNKYFEKYPNSTNFTSPEPIDPSLKGVLCGYIPTTDPLLSSTSTDFTENPTTNVIPHSILHWIQKDDPQGPIPSNPSSDPQYVYWEYGILLWRAEQGSVSVSEILKYDEGQIKRPTVRIRNPDDGDIFSQDESITVDIKITSDEKTDRVEYLVDKNLIKTLFEKSKSYSFVPENKSIKKGKHTLLVVVYTEEGITGEDSVSFEVE